MNLLLKKCSESDPLHNYNNLGLDWLIKRYEKVINNTWKTVKKVWKGIFPLSSQRLFKGKSQ